MFRDLNPPKPILDHRDPRIASQKKSVGIIKKAKNVVKATARVIEAVREGSEIFATKEERERRLSICNVCGLWKPSGNLGMGECTHEKCGCTKLKRGLATERCPLNKW